MISFRKLPIGRTVKSDNLQKSKKEDERYK